MIADEVHDLVPMVRDLDAALASAEQAAKPDPELLASIARITAKGRT